VVPKSLSPLVPRSAHFCFLLSTFCFASDYHLTPNGTNSPRYTLAKGPFTVEDLGSLISANTQERE